MQTQIKRIGNSKGLTLSPSLLEELGWNESTALELKVVDGGLVIAKSVPSLDELLSSVPPCYGEAEENWGSAIGKEVDE